jgi:hypothetical protein
MWSLILREEHRLRMFENRVLRRIFVPKRDEVKGERRKFRFLQEPYRVTSQKTTFFIVTAVEI